ncbi:hypothetical protein AAVH_08469 [Aphelenchoides avenae]|nr:hypothetical protein AAVH_08469 [Aphelenchus avenae]
MGQAALIPDDAARILRTNREGSPLKNETVCFVDESTFRYFSRLLRPNVLMVATPMPSFVDALRSVLQFHLTDKVGRVIFWFCDCHVTFTGQMLLAIELSRHYATHYQDILQYVVAIPTISSRHHIWTCGLFKLLAQMGVTLPNARLVMCPFESSNTMQAVANGLKSHLRDHYQLDLWSHYDAVPPLVEDAKPATKQSDASSLCKQSVDAKPATSGTTKKGSHRTPSLGLVLRPRTRPTPIASIPNRPTLTGKEQLHSPPVASVPNRPTLTGKEQLHANPARRGRSVPPAETTIAPG